MDIYENKLVNTIDTKPLWFRASFRPSVGLVNTIETTPLLVSLSNLAHMLTMMRG